MVNRKLGKFQIAQHNVEEHPEMVRKIMGETIIVRCEAMYDSDAFYYTALSEHFDVCRLGEIVPEYAVCIDSDLGITFKRLL